MIIRVIVGTRSRASSVLSVFKLSNRTKWVLFPNPPQYIHWIICWIVLERLDLNSLILSTGLCSAVVVPLLSWLGCGPLGNTAWTQLLFVLPSARWSQSTTAAGLFQELDTVVVTFWPSVRPILVDRRCCLKLVCIYQPIWKVAPCTNHFICTSGFFKSPPAHITIYIFVARAVCKPAKASQLKVSLVFSLFCWFCRWMQNFVQTKCVCSHDLILKQPFFV